MSNLPPRGEKKWSDEDVDHLYARRWAADQIKELQNGRIEMERSRLAMMADVNTQLAAIRDSLNNLPSILVACKQEVKQEMQMNHPDRLELERVENRLEGKITSAEVTLGNQLTALDVKIDKQWLKITVSVAVVATICSSIGGFVAFMIFLNGHVTLG